MPGIGGRLRWSMDNLGSLLTLAYLFDESCPRFSRLGLDNVYHITIPGMLNATIDTTKIWISRSAVNSPCCCLRIGRKNRKNKVPNTPPQSTMWPANVVPNHRNRCRQFMEESFLDRPVTNFTNVGDTARRSASRIAISSGKTKCSPDRSVCRGSRWPDPQGVTRTAGRVGSRSRHFIIEMR